MNKINISSSQIELLVALVETGSFSDAAQVMGLTQSAVSHGLARLETELGVVLVERGRRGITLTTPGHDVLMHAREMVAHLGSIRQIAISAAGGGVVGKLRLGITQPLSSRLLTGIVTDFQQQYPDVELTVIGDSSQDWQQGIRDGLVEVGIVSDSSSGIDSRLLNVEEIVAVVSVHHPFAAQSSVSAEDVYHAPLIAPRFGREVIVPGLWPANTRTGRPPVRHLVSDPGLMLSMARTGLGIALLPRSLLVEDRRDGLVAVPLTVPLFLRVNLGVRSWDSASPVVQLFVKNAQAWSHRNGFMPMGE